jgi:hypothetical protein
MWRYVIRIVQNGGEIFGKGGFMQLGMIGLGRMGANMVRLQIFTDRYIGGADPYLQVITAQTIDLQNERNDVDILRRRMDASVLLIEALGGG